MNVPIDAISQVRWLDAINNSSSTEIPAWGLVRVVSVSTAGVLTVDQPNSNGQDVFLNGPVPIPASGKGTVTYDCPNFALYETADGTPATGETWGAGNGSYKLRKNNEGFRIAGGNVSGRTFVCRAVAAGMSSFSGASCTGVGYTSIPHDTFTALDLGSAIFDVGGYFDSGTPTRLTVPADGYYLVTAQFNWDTGYAATTCYGFVAKNDVTQYVRCLDSKTSGQFLAMNVVTIIDMSAGDYLLFKAKQDSGSANNVGVGPVTIHKVG